MEIDPTETKSVHVKTYVEPYVEKKIVEYQKRYHFESVSAAVRALILHGLSSEEQAVSIRKSKGFPVGK
jgi:hypothetical protein